MTGPWSSQLCRDCGQDHQSGGEALHCTERIADACGCGHCPNCQMAAWWRAHPRYVDWKIEQTEAG